MTSFVTNCVYYKSIYHVFHYLSPDICLQRTVWVRSWYIIFNICVSTVKLKFASLLILWTFGTNMFMSIGPARMWRIKSTMSSVQYNHASPQCLCRFHAISKTNSPAEFITRQWGCRWVQVQLKEIESASFLSMFHLEVAVPKNHKKLQSEQTFFFPSLHGLK